MRDGALPAILLCVIAGMPLVNASRRAAATSVLLLLFAALTASALIVPFELRLAVVVLCWGLVIVGALGVLRARPLPVTVTILFATAAGLSTSAMTALVGQLSVLALSLPWVAVWIPATLLAGSGRAIIVKVLASWILAVALLSTGLTLSQGVNSGSDHLD